MRNEHGPLGKAWADIGSDCDWQGHGGKWARHIEGTRYHVIRFENCEDWGDGATGYHCDLQEVDIASEQLGQACKSSCVPFDALNEYGEPIEAALYRWMQVEALSSYGAYAPLWQDASGNSWALIRAAKRESRMLTSDSEAYEQRMDRPVNRIGSTAREYAAGDTSSAILRGLAEGDQVADIMARMGMLQVVKVG